MDCCCFGRFSAQAEQSKIPWAMAGMAGHDLSTETNLISIRGVLRKEFRHLLNLTGTHAIKVPWTARTRCLRTATLGRINFNRHY